MDLLCETINWCSKWHNYIEKEELPVGFSCLETSTSFWVQSLLFMILLHYLKSHSSGFVQELEQPCLWLAQDMQYVQSSAKQPSIGKEWFPFSYKFIDCLNSGRKKIAFHKEISGIHYVI